MLKSYSPTISLLGLSSISSPLINTSVKFLLEPFFTVYDAPLNIFGAVTSVVFILNVAVLFLFFMFIKSNDTCISPNFSVSIL